MGSDPRTGRDGSDTDTHRDARVRTRGEGGIYRPRREASGGAPVTP